MIGQIILGAFIGATFGVLGYEIAAFIDARRREAAKMRQILAYLNAAKESMQKVNEALDQEIEAWKQPGITGGKEETN